MTSRHELLAGLHELVEPRGYLEIGAYTGQSLALSRTPSVAVDPVNRVTEPISCDLEFVTATSDDFFARPDPLRHLPDRVVDLAFIDGMHLFEFVLRDFINVERHSHPGTVVVLDDMLPRNHEEAARERHTTAWTGDVFKMIPVLARYRPDLTCVPVDTTPTGTVLVLGLDRNSRVLSEAYDQIVAEWVTPDPQEVPPEILGRTIAVAPAQALAPDFWRWLVAERARLRGGRAHQMVARRATADLAGQEPAALSPADRVLALADATRRAIKPRTRWRRLRQRIERRRR
ncbi:class I SAM-dependent methyltransferase [Ornithinimicrobium cavernae]|uniref:class I SAM-dependent methyltransferase n=1 Tax=Ornithinimicrobium cavernae TaxID=2666047 RepID=UPI000D69E739|nr:class I SAM-dependent methyltransferase [Ornithinimicrobium cavernae]